MSHDALDNLRTWTQPGEGKRRYDYDGSNRLTVVRNAGGAAIIGLGYDVQGNLSITNGQGYQFDFGKRLRGNLAGALPVRRPRPAQLGD
nr:RHS repeat domain-containing protein [Stenotrophomonas maltophilia]